MLGGAGDKISERMCRLDSDDHYNVGKFALNTCGYLLLHVMEANGTFHTHRNITAHGYVKYFTPFPCPYFYSLLIYSNSQIYLHEHLLDLL
jgi:hypothetical protein